MMNLLTNFYDKLFLYFYKLKKYDDLDTTPEVFPMIVISAAQAGNVFFILICFFFLIGLDFSYLPKSFIFIAIIVYSFNFYIYQIKKRKNIILSKKIKLSLGFKFFTYFYFIFSYLSPFFLIYIFNEYGGIRN